MKYSVTTALEKIRALEDTGRRTWVIQGGTSAAKTISILLFILDWSIIHPTKKSSIFTDTLPHLRDGAMSDFLDICLETGILDIADWSRTLHELTLPNHSVIQFRSVELMGAHGPRRDLLYVNEANSIDWNTYRELAKRTRGIRIIDFNPINEFWAHTELVNNELRRDDVAFLKLTYRDNEALDENTIRDIEMERGDGTSNWWRVYGLGEIGSLEGNVYEGWEKLDEVPQDARLVRYGLDFGFSNDETAMVAIYEMPDGTTSVVDQSEDIQAVEAEGKATGLCLEEIIYQKGILPSQYKELLMSHNIDPSVLIVADGARPEIIAEIEQAGYMIVAANKDAGSVKRGIDRVKDRKISYVGKNLEREFLTYAWRKKRSTGETLDVPQDGNDHLMDALRYAIDDLSEPKFSF